MHIVIWKYDVMEGKSRQDLLESVQADAPDYRKVSGLVLWKSKAAADAFFNREWDGETSRRWESAAMTRMDYDAPLVVESEQGRVITVA